MNQQITTDDIVLNFSGQLTVPRKTLEDLFQKGVGPTGFGLGAGHYFCQGCREGKGNKHHPSVIMKITKSAALVWLFASIPSFGAVETTLFHITTNDTFTVPDGKVLIIENFMSVEGGTSKQRLEKGTNSFILGFDDSREFGVRLPIKIPEGWTFRGFADVNGYTTDVWVFGLLVSPADLFAAASHRIDQIAVNGKMASLGIQTASPRPARINVEKSSETDKGWIAAESAVVTPTTDKTRYTATVPVEGDKGFIRTKARPREQ